MSDNDRRVRRTRSALRSSLISLLEGRDLRSLSVREVCSLADVNRSTFYLHYRSIDDLLRDAARATLHDVADWFDGIELDNLELDRPPEPLVRLFEHVGKHATLFRALLGEGHAFHPELLPSFVRVAESRIQQLQAIHGTSVHLADPALVAHAAVGSLVGAIAWWLGNGMPHGPAYMADRCAWMAVSGSYSMLGIRPLSLS